MTAPAERIYSALIRDNTSAREDLPAGVREHVAPNGLRQLGAGALQSSGDQMASASTVLPWLFGVLGVPSALTGVLVPVRESLSMLPQAMITPWVLRVRQRRWVHVTGAIIQALAVAAMALTAAFTRGLLAGALIITALAVFSLGRCLTSIASKDVQGRTLPKGQRGQITGWGTTIAGLVAITLGLGIRLLGGSGTPTTQLVILLTVAAALWVGVAVIYAGIREPDEDPAAQGTTEQSTAQQSTAQGPKGSQHTEEAQEPTGGWFADAVSLLREDRPFRHFVTVRSLLLVSSLSPPFIVALSVASGVEALQGLGGFILASGVAELLGGRIFGPLADRSSRRVMSLGAGAASVVILALVAIVQLSGGGSAGDLPPLLFVLAYFLLTMLHTGVRVGRKTYVVDMADGDQRTRYVAVSNSAMGIVLLLVGVITSALAAVDVAAALVMLAVMGLLGVLLSARLPEVSAS